MAAGLCRLQGRGVLEVSGPDRVAFLQALVSNDVTDIAPGTCRYAALLTPQGKFLHDFLVIATEGQERLLLDCEGGRIDDLKRRLVLYRLRSKVAIADVSADFVVLAAPPAGFADARAIVVDDPRHAGLGQRVYWPAGESLPPVSNDAADWERRRLLLGIPDGSRDMEVEKTILLEARLDELNGIDFRKGCYVGQEITARSRYRGTVRRKLCACRVDGPLPPPGTAVHAGEAQVGEVRSGFEDRVLALLRLDRGDGPLRAGDAVLEPEQPCGPASPA